MATSRTSGLGMRARLVLRRILTEWRYSLGVILILGVGIGSAAVGLAVVDGVLLQPLAYREPDRIGVIRVDVGRLQHHPGLAQNEILDLRLTRGTFKAVEWIIFGPASLGAGSEAASVSMAGVSAGFFDMLGASPILGRPFREEDYQTGAVMLSHHLWRTAFAGDQKILGRSILVAGRPREVIGVLPPDFRLHLGPGSYAPPVIDLWDTVRAVHTRPGTGFLWGWNTIVRLEDGVSFERANAFLEAFARQQKEKYPTAYGDSRLRFTVSPLLTDVVGDSKPAIVAALLGVLLLLVTAIVNASSLVVVAARRRRHETAVRAAIGASRSPLLADTGFESLVLSLMGGALGGGLAVWGMAGLRVVVPREVPRWESLALGWDAVALPTALAVLVLAATSILATWRQMRGTPWQCLGRDSGTTSTPRAAGQSILVGFQVVVAVVLLFGAVQLTRSAIALLRTDLGFEPRGVIALGIPVEDPNLDRQAENARYGLIRDRLEQIAGVTAVGAISSPPLSGRGTINNFTPNGTHTGGTGNEQVANFWAVLPGYFRSVRTPFVAGRDFTAAENAQGAPVAIIDESLARTAFPGQDPIGRMIGVSVPGGHRYPRLPDPRIVGVVAHARLIEPTRDVRPQIYLPFGFWRWAPLSFTVRTAGDPRAVVAAARQVAKELNSGQPLSRVRLVSDDLSAATSALRAVTALVIVLAVLAASLSALGLYAVVSYLVIQQRRALAIRMALGASPGQLLRMQLRRVALILAFAVPAGVGLCVAGSRLLKSLVYGVAVTDVGSVAVAAVLGVLVGLLAALGPARRAAAADPRVAFEVY